MFYVLSAFRATHNTLVSRSSLFLAINRARALDPFPPSFSVPPPWIDSTRRRVVRASSARRESNRNESNPRVFIPIARVLASSTVAPRARAIGRRMSSSRRMDEWLD